ncbi:MAG: ester cyclase [Bacteroidota bacterium]
METTTLESNKKIAREFWESFAKGDVQQVEKLWGSDYKLHFPGKINALSKEESKQVMKEYNTGFPDMKVSIEDQIAEGDLVVTRTTIGGTHKGEFQGFAASNKKIIVTAISTQRIVDGKIVEEWSEFDALGMMKQIGAIPEMANVQKPVFTR